MDGEYILLQPDPDGIIRSRVFPGLWLVIGELLGNHMQQVLTTLQQGLESAAHQEFVPPQCKSIATQMRCVYPDRTGDVR